jgi:hypothetical protein
MPAGESALSLSSPHTQTRHVPHVTCTPARCRFGKWMARFGDMRVTSVNRQRGRECGYIAAGASTAVGLSECPVRGDFMELDFDFLLSDDFINLVNEHVFDYYER